jgi:hypothetical protein
VLGEVVGLQVSDRVSVRGAGLRLSRAVLCSNGGGALYVDTLKNGRARTVPLLEAVVPIVERWAARLAAHTLNLVKTSERREQFRPEHRLNSGDDRP